MSPIVYRLLLIWFWLVPIFMGFIGCGQSDSIALSKSDKKVITREIAKLTEELKAEDATIRLKAALTVTGLAQQLKEKDYKAKLRSTVEPLIFLLKDSDSQIRAVASAALGEIGDNSAVEPLIKALLDVEAEVRFNSVYNLGDLKDKRAVEPIISLLKVESDAYIRTAAAEALGKIKDKRAVEPLISALKDEDGAVRAAAAEALGKLGSQKAIASLKRLAKEDSREEVRLAAKKSLDKLRC
jgi:HEAT repeat protein